MNTSIVILVRRREKPAKAIGIPPSPLDESRRDCTTRLALGATPRICPSILAEYHLQEQTRRRESHDHLDRLTFGVVLGHTAA